MADYAFTPLELARMDRVTRSKALALGREVERLRGQVARVEALCEKACLIPDECSLPSDMHMVGVSRVRAALAEPEGGES